MKQLKLRWISFVAIAFCSVGAHASQIYSISDLGSAIPFAMNDLGSVAGTYYYGNKAGDEFIYKNGVFSDVGDISANLHDFSLNNSGQLLVGDHLYNSNNGNLLSVKDSLTSGIIGSKTVVPVGLTNQGNVAAIVSHYDYNLYTPVTTSTIWNADNNSYVSTYDTTSYENTIRLSGINDNNEMVGTCSFNSGNDVACIKLILITIEIQPALAIAAA